MIFVVSSVFRLLLAIGGSIFVRLVPLLTVAVELVLAVELRLVVSVVQVL